MTLEMEYKDTPCDRPEGLLPIGEKCFDDNEPLKCRIYKRRWLILFIYILFCFVSTSQWTQYAIINNVVSRYYNVKSDYVDWTAIIYMAVYVPAIIPAIVFLEKKVQYITQILLVTIHVIKLCWSISSELPCEESSGSKFQILRFLALQKFNQIWAFCDIS
jgi:hypothetical protein